MRTRYRLWSSRKRQYCYCCRSTSIRPVLRNPVRKYDPSSCLSRRASSPNPAEEANANPCPQPEAKTSKPTPRASSFIPPSTVLNITENSRYRPRYSAPDINIDSSDAYDPPHRNESLPAARADHGDRGRRHARYRYWSRWSAAVHLIHAPVKPTRQPGDHKEEPANIPDGFRKVISKAPVILPSDVELAHLLRHEHPGCPQPGLGLDEKPSPPSRVGNSAPPSPQQKRSRSPPKSR